VIRYLLLAAAVSSLPALAEDAAQVPPAPAVPAATGPAAAPPAEVQAVPAVPAAPAERPAFAASEEGCESGRASGLFEGPVQVAFYEADLGTGRRACGRTEVGVGTRLRALIDTPDFYGNIGLSALVYGSYALSPRTEFFGTLEAYDFQFVQNATLQGTAGALGGLTAGATHQVWRYDGRGVLAATARLLLPTSLASTTRTLGGEVGAAWSHRQTERLRFHGSAGVDVTAALGPVEPLPRVGVHLLGGAEYFVCSGFSAVLDAQAHFGRRALLDALAPALALRARLWRGLGLELAGTLPLAGAERTDASLGLRLAWRAD
jgi:hypothetical protein